MGTNRRVLAFLDNRRRWRYDTSWLWYVVAVVWVLDARRMRNRLKQIPVLEPSQRPPAQEHVFLAAPEVELSELVRRAASAHAQAAKIELLDLIPADLPALQSLGVAQVIDRNAYRRNRLERGRSAGQAVLVSARLLERAGIHPPPRMDAAELVRLAGRLKRFAGNAADVAVAPGLAASREDPFSHWYAFQEALGMRASSVLRVSILVLAILVAGAFFDLTSVVALAAFHLQPLLVFPRLKLHPRDLLVASLFRLPLEISKVARLIVTQQQPDQEEVERLRPVYEALLADGLEPFFLPRREACPMCGSAELAPLVRMPDLMQGKPGRFSLQRCRGCGHVFQNPRLSPAGLDFYYRDFYDGLGESMAESFFGSGAAFYTPRAAMVKGLCEPRLWLDVGTGHGHFCCAAKETWPETEFHGLDIGESVDQAARAGWIQKAYRGLLPQVARKLAGRYDVVSMFHCLEHTSDPRAELDAAHTALGPGGFLVIEVPDPEYPLARLLGKFWLPWWQPQHLHLLPMGNLQQLMREAGFEPVLAEKQNAYQSIDFFCATLLLMSWIAPRPVDVPWRPRPNFWARARYTCVWNFGFPLTMLGWVMDLASGPLIRAAGYSNAYRVVARKRSESTA